MLLEVLTLNTVPKPRLAAPCCRPLQRCADAGQREGAGRRDHPMGVSGPHSDALSERTQWGLPPRLGSITVSLRQPASHACNSSLLILFLDHETVSLLFVLLNFSPFLAALRGCHLALAFGNSVRERVHASRSPNLGPASGLSDSFRFLGREVVASTGLQQPELPCPISRRHKEVRTGW